MSQIAPLVLPTDAELFGDDDAAAMDPPPYPPAKRSRRDPAMLGVVPDVPEHFTLFQPQTWQPCK
jgi:hypothetical protein